MKEPTTAIGRRVRDERQKMKLTCDQLGRACGVSSKHIYNIESGKHFNLTIATVFALATVLGVKPAWLAWGDDEI